MGIELQPGMIARILTDEYPENVGKRVKLVRRPMPGSDLVCTSDLDIYLKSFIVDPVDILLMPRIGSEDSIEVGPGTDTGMFMVILKDGDMEVLESDNPNLS